MTYQRPKPGCLHTFIRNAYYGGMVQVFRGSFDYESRGGQPLNYGDVNSMYPWAMLGEVPTELACVREGNIDFEKHISRYLGFLDCTVSIPEDVYLPPLPYRAGKTGKLIFPVGRFRGTWTSIELAQLSRIGGTIEQHHRSVWFSGAKIFTKYVEYWYRFRDKRAADYNPAMDMVAKLFLNSLYGKFGMNSEREKLWFFPTDEDFGEHRLIPIADAQFGAYKEITHSEPPYVIPHIAAWITARSRIRLWGLMADMLERGYSIYYCDTDSVVTDAPIVDSAALGDLKTVCQIKRARFVAPKMYFIEEVSGDHMVKAKGFSGGFGAKSLTEAEFNAIVNNRAKVKIRRMRKMKEGMRTKQRFPAMNVQDKGVRAGILDEKRIHLPDGNTKPITVMELT